MSRKLLLCLLLTPAVSFLPQAVVMSPRHQFSSPLSADSKRNSSVSSAQDELEELRAKHKTLEEKFTNTVLELRQDLDLAAGTRIKEQQAANALLQRKADEARARLERMQKEYELTLANKSKEALTWKLRAKDADQKYCDTVREFARLRERQHSLRFLSHMALATIAFRVKSTLRRLLGRPPSSLHDDRSHQDAWDEEDALRAAMAESEECEEFVPDRGLSLPRKSKAFSVLRLRKRSAPRH